jgi:hypothetical protein
MATIRLPPFEKKDELVLSTDDPKAVPNKHFPLLTNEVVQDYINKELSTQVIDQIYAKLWFVAAKTGRIDPLHQHALKLRSVIISEDPGLHLVWYYKTVYLKPIPHWLLNHDFWTNYLIPQTATARPNIFDPQTLPYTCRMALGFLRSYAHLIRHESDFLIAQNQHLIPTNISYTAFEFFISHFLDVPNHAVAPRYHYGQLGLTRLNFAVRLLRPSTALTLHKFLWHQPWYYQELERWAAPLLFLFAAFSLILSSMQVVLQALGDNTWQAFVKVSWGFSVAVVLFIITAGVSVVVGLIVGMSAQFGSALRHRW